MPRLARILILFLPAMRLQGASVVTVPLPPVGEVADPIQILVPQSASLELAFPYPVEDWVGRGFTTDPTKFKGDFEIDASRGQPRVYLTALTPGQHALLHLSLRSATGILSYPIEAVAAPDSLAWSAVNFVVPATPAPSTRPLSFELPTEPSTPEQELALLGLIRLLGELPPSLADKSAARSPNLWNASLSAAPEDFGAFSVALRRLVQDRASADLAFEARVQNRTAERLWIDPQSWSLRNGERVYRAGTIDFTGTIEPFGQVTIRGVIVPRPQELPPYVDLDQLTLLSANVADRSSPRPVHSYPVPLSLRP